MKKALSAVALLLASCAALAGNQDAIQTCYSGKVPAPKDAGANTALFVVVDQTTLFDTGLKQSIANNIRPFLVAGNEVSVIQFSAFTQGHYTDVLVSARLDPELSGKQRDDVSKPVLNKLDACLANQPRQAGQLVGGALKSAFASSSNGIDKSDVLASLKDISGKVHRSTAKRKIVLVASDMLENSSVSSFYSKQAVRQIDPKKELDLVEKNGLYGDFGNVEVYVIGAGLLVEDAKAPKGVYRSPQIMQSLSKFWHEWFEKSHANLIDFGAPSLLNMIK